MTRVTIGTFAGVTLIDDPGVPRTTLGFMISGPIQDAKVESMVQVKQCPICDGERVVAVGTGAQTDFAPCPVCVAFDPETHAHLHRADLQNMVRGLVLERFQGVDIVKELAPFAEGSCRRIAIKVWNGEQGRRESKP